MLSPTEISRYAKQIILPEFRTEGQEKLREAKVLVIGAGGLGCPILQYLTAAGVGTIGIADGDKIDISNLQRQVLYTEQEIGQQKAEVAVSKLKGLNPYVNFNIYPVFVDAANALEMFKGYDIIVDGSDNFATRYLVNDACVMLDKPFVSGAIYKFEGQVSVFNFQGGPTYRCIFPEPPGADESPNCAVIGVIATLPGIIGTIQANEVIKMITGIGEVLSGKLLVLDTLTMQTSTFKFRLNEANKNITHLQDSEQFCDLTINTISYEDLQQLMEHDPEIQVVDVRAPEEHSQFNIGGINVPLSLLDDHANNFKKETLIVAYCASGVRSAKAVNILMQKGFKQVLSLSNGIRHLSAR